MAKPDVAFGIAASFLAGVLAASFGFSFHLVIAVFLLTAAARIFVFRHFFITVSQIAVFAVAVAFGFLYFQFYLHLKTENQNLPIGTHISFEAVIRNEPRTSEKSQQFTVRAEPPLMGNVRVIAPPIPEFSYGDRVKLNGQILPAQSAIADPVMLFPSATFLGAHRGSRVKEYLLDFKKMLIGEFTQFLPHEAAALLGGITLGARSDFSQELKNQMALSGTTHIVALSGYNITILVIAVAAVFGRWFSRRNTFFITTAIIILFVLMAGAEASAVRAAIMGFLALFAREAGRIYSFRNAAVFAASAMVLVNPTILVFDLGFQLSFLSLLGIVYAAPAIRSIFHMKEDDGGFLDWRGNMTTTLGAQLAVMPLILNSFGQFSLTSFVANILILEFMPLTMLLGFLVAGIGLVFHSLGFLVAWAAYPLLYYEIGVIRFFAVVRLPILNNMVSWGMLALFYVGATSFVFGYYENNKVSLSK